MTSIVRLRHVAQINPSTPAFERLSDDDELTFIPMESVWPGERLDLSAQRTKASVSTGYTRFQDGDILVPKITPTFEAARSVLISGLLGGVGAGTTELHVVRPGPTIEARFLLYLMHTHSFLRLGKAEMYGVAGQQRVPDDFLRDLPVKLPPLEEQRRIADFLDAETARIDKLMSLREVQMGLLRERFDALLVSTLLPSSEAGSWTSTRLKHVFEFSKGGVWGDDPVGDGEDVRCVRVADFDRQALLCDPNPPTERHVPRSLRRGRVLKRGDVLLEKSGGGEKSPVGFAVGFDSRYESVCSNFVAMLRPASGVHARYVGLLMAALYKSGRNIPFIKQTTGIQNLDMEAYLAQPVRIAEPDEQRVIAAFLDETRERVSHTNTKLQSQKRLLAERRQALITAAVIGEFDVSAASGRGIEE